MLKSDAKNSISHLQSLGIETVMLTGDSEEKANEISEKVGTLRQANRAISPNLGTGSWSIASMKASDRKV